MQFTKMIICLLALLITCSLAAQQPQKILGPAKENRSKDYYMEQATLWKKEIKAKPTDGYAWFQHYKAQRSYHQLSNPETWRESPNVIFERLSPIIVDAKKHIDGTFYYFLLKAVNTTGERNIDWLEKAFQLAPDQPETYESLLIFYSKNFMEEKATAVAKKMLQTNYYSNATLMWSYNTLQSLKPNAVFIANGDMDTMPKWVLQYGKGIRKDVVIVNKWLVEKEKGYRIIVFSKAKIKRPGFTSSDFESSSLYADNLVLHMLKTSQRPIYMGCGTDIKFFKQHQIEKDIYLVGLVLQYAEKNFDNLALALQNFEQKYQLEYLLTNFQTHTDDEIVYSHMNLTYLPGLMQVKKHYQFTAQTTKWNYCQRLIDQIMERSGRKEEIQSWYE